VVNKLPARFDRSAGKIGDMISTYGRFSRWNEPVHVQVPARSTPIATVRRG
jgi:hypothetical protein